MEKFTKYYGSTAVILMAGLRSVFKHRHPPLCHSAVSDTQLIWGQSWHVMRSVTARTERVPIKGEDSADGVSAYRKYDVRRHAQLQSSCSRRRLKREIETQKPRTEISGSSVQTETLVTMAEENIFLFVPNLIGECQSSELTLGRSLALDRFRLSNKW